jgi:nitrate reductase gamma subunit
MQYLILAVLPYVTILVLVAGLTWRFRTWWKKPRAKVVLFPAAKNNVTVVGRVIKDILLFSKTFTLSKKLWVMTGLFHLGLLLVIMGHFRMITEFGFLWNWLHLDASGIDRVAFGMGMTAGGIILIGIVLLISRRLTPMMRILSIFQDYFVLNMLLAIIILGLAMRILMPVHVDEVQAYVRGVLTFRPMAEISNPLFSTHLFLAQILMMYFPFSKLVHLVSKPVAESWTMR